MACQAILAAISMILSLDSQLVTGISSCKRNDVNNTCHRWGIVSWGCTAAAFCQTLGTSVTAGNTLA
jgi:hypothetical protein